MKKTPSLDFALSLKDWEIEHVPCFLESKLTQRLFLLLAGAVIKQKQLRLTEVYLGTPATEVGVRKRIKQLCEDGWIKIITNSDDKRTKFVVPSEKFLVLLLEYQAQAAKIFKQSITQD